MSLNPIALICHIEPTSYCLFALTVVLLIIGACAIYGRAFARPLDGIPFNEKACKTIWDDTVSLGNDTDGLAQWCSKQLRKHGYPLCQIFMGPFSKPVVLVADLGNARDIIMKSDFDRSVYIIDRFPLFGGSQILKRTGEEWRTSRGWLKDLLTIKHLQTVVGPQVYASVCRLIDLWKLSSEVAGQDRPFDMIEDLKCLALDVVTQFHHGDDFRDLCLERQLQLIDKIRSEEFLVRYKSAGPIHFPRAPIHQFGEAVTEIGDRMGAIYTMRAPPWLISWWTKYCTKYYRRLFAVKQSFMRRRFDEAVDRMRNGKAPINAIDHMVIREDKAAKKAKREPKYNDQIMVDEAFGNHIAGQHTTSSAMVWILKYLTENQDVQTRLLTNLKAAFPSAAQEKRFPSQMEIMTANLPYLEAAVEETLRLRAAFIIARDVVKDTEILGHAIPKGTVCLLVCQGLAGISQHSPKGSGPARAISEDGKPDPQVFDPERWLVQEGDQITFDGSRNPHMAFGLGIRACWGRRLAELEMRMMTAMVVWEFHLKPVPASLQSHEAIYDFSYRATVGYLCLRGRRSTDKSG